MDNFIKFCQLADLNIFSIKKVITALAGVAQGIEWQPVHRKVDSQSGHGPGSRAGSPAGGVREATS